MSSKNRKGFYRSSILYILAGVLFGCFTGFINTILSKNMNAEERSDFNSLSFDIRETLSRDKGCTSALSTALILKARKEANKSFFIDGFTMPDGKQLIIGKNLEKYNLKVDSLSIENLNGIGKDSDGYRVYTAELAALLSSSRMFGKTEKRTLSRLLVTLDNRDRLVKCSNNFSGDAIKIMVSLCEGSRQIYNRETGHCHSLRAMASQKRGISSIK